MPRLVLASGSTIRADLLTRIGLTFEVMPARIDEAAIRDSMLAEGAPPRDIADALAEQKALKIARKDAELRVIGCDQILALGGVILSKPEGREGAAAQLRQLAGREHRLITACVVAEEARPVWRVVTEARLWMKPLSESFIEAYLNRNWPEVSDSVGAYKLEQEGPRLFERISGDHFTILGLPLLELCAYLERRGEFVDD
ncbi:septum formation protein Maf [Rhodobacterales bacterium HKCCE3408]|nr:septum formation protein Maf [Rhodobacterales bacterium HKCCE3408]